MLFLIILKSSQQKHILSFEILVDQVLNELTSI